MKVSVFFIITVLLTFFGAARAQTVSPATELPVKVIGTFIKVESDGEHASGYDVELWQQGDKIFGLISAHRGLIGDPPAGLLEDVRFDAKTRKFSFTAKLSLGQYSENKGSRDVFEFNGILTEKRLSGSLQIKDLLCEACRENKKINLPRSKEESSWQTEYKSYADWKADADRILQRRGPRWSILW